MKLHLHIILIILLYSCGENCSKTIIGKEVENTIILKQVNEYTNCNDTSNYIHNAYYPNDTLAHSVEIVKNKKHGLYKSFDLNGNPVKEGHYINGKRNGVWKTWNSHTYLERTFVNGIKEGYTYEKHNDGIEVTGEYKNDKEEGEWVWKNKGKIIRTCGYSNGKKNGTLKKIYPNGLIQVKAIYKNDSIIGVPEIRDSTGLIIPNATFRAN